MVIEDEAAAAVAAVVGVCRWKDSTTGKPHWQTMKRSNNSKGFIVIN